MQRQPSTRCGAFSRCTTCWPQRARDLPPRAGARFPGCRARAARPKCAKHERPLHCGLIHISVRHRPADRVAARRQARALRNEQITRREFRKGTGAALTSAADAVQCGLCTPGMVTTCAALVESNRSPPSMPLRPMRTAAARAIRRRSHRKRFAPCVVSFLPIIASDPSIPAGSLSLIRDNTFDLSQVA